MKSTDKNDTGTWYHMVSYDHLLSIFACSRLGTSQWPSWSKQTSNQQIYICSAPIYPQCLRSTMLSCARCGLAPSFTPSTPFAQSAIRQWCLVHLPTVERKLKDICALNCPHVATMSVKHTLAGTSAAQTSPWCLLCKAICGPIWAVVRAGVGSNARCNKRTHLSLARREGTFAIIVGI